MKKTLLTLFYAVLIATVILVITTCSSLLSALTSAPWTIGLLYPAIYLTTLNLILGIVIFLYTKRKQELIISASIILLQLLLVFSI
ncbi:MAG: hypothetical protein RR585_13875 [Coprobacillus sp.]